MVDIRIRIRLVDWNDIDLVLGREFEVSNVVSRNRHDGSSPVTDQHVISDPNWNLLLADWVDCIAARKHAGFGSLVILSITITLARRRLAIIVNRFFLIGRRQTLNEWMFRRDYHVGRSKQSVRASRIDPEHVIIWLARKPARCSIRLPLLNLVFATDKEVNFRAGTAADPIAL